MPIPGLIRAALLNLPRAASESSPQPSRGIYPLFTLARQIRRLQNPAALPQRLLPIHRNAASLLHPNAPPLQLLWHHWLLQLGQKYLCPPADPALLAQLWQHAFRHQSPAGYLHPLTPDTLLDAFVYDELCALHAAYNIAQFAANPEMLHQVRRAIAWHVQNTQPDNTTHEPWALAAFAALDPTHTFAEQQLHDALLHLPVPPAPSIITDLLDDALMTLDAPSP